MRVNDFVRKVTIIEGKKKSISIAQVSEVVKIINDLTNGALYMLITGIKAK
jgi:hypothetical protein